ncbi:hypothetical protein J4Q44_G00115230, partial [Coregonus suidteri]
MGVCSSLFLFRVGAYQLLEGWLVQVTLQGELAQGLPWGLVSLHLYWVPLDRVVVSNWTACHQRRTRQPLKILQRKRKCITTNISPPSGCLNILARSIKLHLS